MRVLKTGFSATKFTVAVVFIFSILSSAFMTADETAYANGAIEIDSCGELQLIGQDEAYPLDGNYVLTQDIDCTPEEVAPGSTIFSEDFEDGAEGWVDDGVVNEGMANSWNLMTETCGYEIGSEEDENLRQVGPFTFGSTVYGTNGNAGPECEPDSNDEDSYLMSPEISLPATEIGWVVQFDSWSYDEGGPCTESEEFDSKDIAVTTDGGENADVLNYCYALHRDSAGDDQLNHKLQRFSLSNYAEQDIQLLFRYLTEDSCCDLDLGWFIDNVTIYEGVINDFYGIGNGEDYFTGTFDGQGHNISNLTVKYGGDSYTGLFNYVAEGAEIKDITLASGEVQAEDGSPGGLAGINYGTISNSHSNLSVEGEDRTGGLAGRNWGLITGSSATGSVYGGDDDIGGLVGRNHGTIERSWSNNETGEDDYGVDGYCDVGGLVGSNAEDGIILNSFSRSSVQDRDECGAGGLVGFTESNSKITKSYSTGSVTGDGNTGGLIGSAYDGTIIEYSFWDEATSGFEYACGWQEGPFECDHQDRAQGRNTTEMKQIATFTTSLGDNSWDFEDVWDIDGVTNDGYPFFSVEEESVPDDDTDGISNSVENAGPNNGDANNDGTPDSEQANVASMVDPLNGKYAVLVVDEQCSIQSLEIVSEDQVANTKDSKYDYPAGLMDFRIDCGENGFTATITQYYYGITGDFVVRKFKPDTGFFTIENASTSNQNIASQSAKVATYQVKDGGNLDLDGEENGSIEDPAGLGQIATTSQGALAGTGANSQSILTLALLFILSSVILIVTRKSFSEPVA